MVPDDHSRNGKNAVRADTKSTSSLRPNDPRRVPCRERFPTPCRRQPRVRRVERIPRLCQSKSRHHRRSSLGGFAIKEGEQRPDLASGGLDERHSVGLAKRRKLTNGSCVGAGSLRAAAIQLQSSSTCARRLYGVKIRAC